MAGGHNSHLTSVHRNCFINSSAIFHQFISFLYASEKSRTNPTSVAKWYCVAISPKYTSRIQNKVNSPFFNFQFMSFHDWLSIEWIPIDFSISYFCLTITNIQSWIQFHKWRLRSRCTRMYGCKHVINSFLFHFCFYFLFNYSNQQLHILHFSLF